MTPTPSSLALVTGTSSGIGEAVARELLTRGWRVIGIARRAAPMTDPAYTHIRLDIGDLKALERRMNEQLGPLIGNRGVTRVGLVNNAALVALLGQMAQLDAAALLEVYTVNTVAPILLMGWFLRHSRGGLPLRIVNVSTGAAVIPLPGLGAYGSSKAALRMAGMVLGAELDSAGSGAGSAPDASLLSYEPGLVDTPMQTAARTSSAETLPIVGQFVEWSRAGALVQAGLPAKEIADYLETDGHPRWAERRLGGPPSGATQ
ncbi:MAG TPA: SDR family NAD(P)-dependent oxidoreductase [Gemmatimonadales bacterium]|nr:SDR family NAD(P)-dependent oxidoreductase [Gemmatimonadales bacterium]